MYIDKQMDKYMDDEGPDDGASVCCDFEIDGIINHRICEKQF